MDKSDAIDSGLAEYRAMQKMKFEKKAKEADDKLKKEMRKEYLKIKYANLIELDFTKRMATRIVRFMKKYLFINPININHDDIEKIPGIFRFRCYVYDNDSRIDEIEHTFIEQLDVITCCGEDAETTQILRESLLIDKNTKLQKLLASNSIMKYSIMLDLQIYGIDANFPVSINDKTYKLDDFTKEKLKIAFNKINPSSLNGEKFIQMINHSKALCATYMNDV